MKSCLSFGLAALLLSACTYNNGERQPARSSDELARYNDAGQNIAPDTNMYEQPAYQGDTPPTVIHHIYHAPGYYQSNPNRYYSDPNSVYNDPHSSLYHQNYGRDGYARAQVQAANEASHYTTPAPATRPAPTTPRFYRYSTAPKASAPITAAPAPTTPKVYRYVGTTAASRGPAAVTSTNASRTFTMPKATTPAPAVVTRTYSAPTTARTYSAPARTSTPAPTYRAAPSYHYTPSAPAHH